MARRKAISPVIATVIIVAVTIAVAIAVAFWMAGIIGLFTGFEQLQIVSIIDDAQGIHVTVRNTGTSRASITEVYINGIPCVARQACNVIDNQGNQLGPNTAIPLGSGERVDLVITLQRQSFPNVGPGDTVEVKLMTASGKEYPKLIVLQQYRP